MSDPEINGLRQQIAGLKELLTQRFDGTDMRLEALTDQGLEMGHRLRVAEDAISDFRPRVAHMEREVKDLRRDMRTDASGENKTIRAWHVAAVLAVIAVTVTVLEFFGMLRAPQ